MNKVEVPIGTRYGKWVTTSEKYKVPKSNHYSIDVVCDCGTELTMKSATLTSGRATRCWRCYNGTRPTILTPREVVVNANYISYMKSAKKRGLNWLVDKEQFEELMFRNCFYCGRPPSNSMKDRAQKPRVLPKYNGIDRLVNTLGYFEKNIVPCCRWCNEAKKAKTQEEFSNWVKGLIENYHMWNWS